MKQDVNPPQALNLPPVGSAGAGNLRTSWINIGLPEKLLAITAVFVMVAGIFLFIPALANFRHDWLMQRIIAAKIASLSLEATNGAELPPAIREELLNTAGVHAVSLKRNNTRRLVLGMPSDVTISATYDLRSATIPELVHDSIQALFAPPHRLIRVISTADMMPDDVVDIVIDEMPLQTALWSFAGRIFWIALTIAFVTGALVYLSLSKLLVAPMMKLTRNMISYRGNPEDLTRIIQPSGRSDEIGVAEQELAELQTQLSLFLREKSRLASIGLAVSKINHDLRNMLAGAQLVSDRLAAIPEPTVQLFLPRLIRTLDRAITLCIETLQYGRSEEAPPRKTSFAFVELIREVRDGLRRDEHDPIAFDLVVPDGYELWADRDQLFRVMTNLIRNAIEALEEAQPREAQPLVRIEADHHGAFSVISVADNGPGVPAQVRPHLFKAFQSSARGKGTGLGLVICAELLRAHGGDIELAETAEGATFIAKLPRMPEQAA